MGKKKRDIDGIVRVVIQLFFFIMLPELFQAAFSGVKYIASQMHGSKSIEMVPFIMYLIILTGFTIVSGRFFCGFACAFGSFGDVVYTMSKFIQKKLNKRFPVIPGKVCIYLQKLKYIILAGIILLCFNGMYGFFSLNSPWAVFSKLRAFEFKNAFTVTGIILFILIITGMCIQERFFCQFLCPMGAVFALLPVITLQYPKKREDICLKGCKLCVKNCPVSINPGSRERIGECIGCNKCVSGCPVSNMHILKSINHNIFSIIKAVLLFILVYIFI